MEKDSRKCNSHTRFVVMHDPNEAMPPLLHETLALLLVLLPLLKCINSGGRSVNRFLGDFSTLTGRLLVCLGEFDCLSVSCCSAARGGILLLS